jgi:hypothetical protein
MISYYRLKTKIGAKMASPITTIQTSRVIQDGLQELSRVKKGDFPKALAIIAGLGEQFRSIGELSPISRGRVSFIGDFFLKGLLENKPLPGNNQIQCLIIDLVNLKNALQLEAMFFGLLYPQILTHSRLNRSPLLIELRAALPGILDGITLDRQDPPCFVIDADPIKRFFDGYSPPSL